MKKRVLICSNPDRDIGFMTAERIERILDGKAECSIVPINYGGRDDAVNMRDDMEKSDLVVAIGGDGSIMHAARAAAPSGTPLIGVNRGNKGFLADLDDTNLDMIENAVEGRFSIDRRMMLDVSVIRDGERIYYDYAINDAAISGLSRMVEVSVYGDGVKIASFSGDGVIIASPTGSTAYSMSAGGPIVEPGAENIVITPICSHALIAKPFVLSGERVVTATSDSLARVSAYLAVDGGEGVKLRSNDIIEVKRSAYTADFIKVTGKTFYETVMEKLGER